METHLEGLSLTEEEEGGFVIDAEKEKKGEGNPELCLIGRFIADRTIHTHIMRDCLLSVWRPVKRFQVKETDPNNYMLVLSPVTAGELPGQIPLFHLAIWVQIHDLPIGFMSQNVGWLLVNFIGEFLEYDTKNNDGI